MRALAAASVVFVGIVATVTSVSAQILTPPPRSSGGLFGGPTRPNQPSHELNADVSLFGSYEDNLGGGGGIESSPPVPTDPLAPRQSGTTGQLAGNVRYRYGHMSRYVAASGGAYLYSFRDLAVQPIHGGNLELRVGSDLGRRVSFAAGAEAQYQPTFMLNASPAVLTEDSNGAIAAVDPTLGVVEMRSTSAALTSTLNFRWSTRNHTSALFGYEQQRVTNPLPADSRSYGQSLSHSWDFRRTLSLQMGYQHLDQTYEVPLEFERPTESHEGRLGLEWRKRLSRTRTVSIAGTSGAMQVRTISAIDNRPLEYLAPSMSGSVRLDLGQTWSVSADAHREISVLEGVTLQSFLTDTGSLWFGGNVGGSWVFALNGTYSRGAPHEGETGSFEATTASAQLQFAFSSWGSVVGAYSHYAHQIRDLTTVTPGFPRRFEVNAIRLGITLWMPLYGRSQGPRPFQTGRN